MVRISKNQAKKQFYNGENVYFMPSKLDANNGTFAPSKININEFYSEVNKNTFSEFIVEFERTYCTVFVGRKVSFWGFN